LVAAPAIVRAGSLMPVKTMIEPIRWQFSDYEAVWYMSDGGVRMLKSVNGGEWVDVSSEYYKQPPFEGYIGEYQGITFRESCA